MGWRHLPKAAFQAMPWRNGGGTTWEIASGRFDGGGGEWHWRLSLAEIATDGPFSVFPNIDRVLTVIAGEGIALRRDGADTRILHTGDAIRFMGEAAIDCTLLAGPTRDLNLMVDRRFARFRVNEPVIAEAGAVVLLYAFEDVEIAMEQERMTVAAGDAWMSEGGGAIVVNGRAFWAQIDALSAA